MAENKPADIRKKEILDVALDLFSKQGYSGTSVDHICKKAKITKGGLYWHFSSKKEILLSLVQGLCNSQQAVWKNLEDMEVNQDTLNSLGLSFIHANLEKAANNRFYQVMEIESFNNKDIKEALGVSRNFVHSSLVKFSKKMLEYFGSNMDPNNMAHILEIAVTGIVRAKILGVVDIDPEECWNEVNSMILRSLR